MTGSGTGRKLCWWQHNIVVPTMIPKDTPQVTTAMNMDTSTNDTNQANRVSENIIIVPDNDVTMPPSSPENIPVSISHSEVADIELELNELPSVNPQELL